MRQRPWIFNLLLFFLMLAAQSQYIDSAILQYENQQIERLNIIVETPTDCQESIISNVKSHIKTRTDDVFSQVDFDSDLKLLAKDFNQVTPELESIDGKLQITLRIWAKPIIRCITWSGNMHVATEDLQNELGIKALTVFDRLAFNKAFHKVKAYYVKEGYFEAELDYQTTIDPLTNEVDIDIQICEGRAGNIDKIRFNGFCPDEENELIDLMLTKEYNFFLSWYTHEGIYHEETVQQDQFIIVNYLQNKGYADAKVDISILEKCKNKIELIITACKGEMYHFGKVSFSGNELFCSDDILKQFSFAEGCPYSVEQIRETVGRITDLYGRKGYIDANVDFEPCLDINTLTYSVKLTIEEGSQYHVGLLKVFGNCTTQTNVILHESLLIPGEVFNIDKLKNTEAKLKNVGYFEEVNVFAVKSEGASGLGSCYRDVHIEVKETATGHFGAFAGYSTAESLFGGINITERNFNYKGLFYPKEEGLCHLRGGGEYAHATMQVGLKSRKYILSWAKPFFMDSPWTVGFDIERNNNRYISNDYEINSTAFIAHATYRYNDFVRFGWHYRLKNSDVTLDHDYKKDDNNDSNKTEKEKKEEKKAADKEKDKKEKDKNYGKKQLKKDAENDGLISATGVSLTYDSTDHPMTPRSGFRSQFDLEFTGLGGDYTYFSVAYLNSYFIPLGKKNILRYRADFRFILPFGRTTPKTVPLDERLFLGGDTMVRGYRAYRLGPMYPGSDDPRGGISEQFYSVEFARRFHDKFEAFGFFDAGYLSLDVFKFDMPYCSVGLGARVKIMESIPALTFGYGVPLNPRKNSQVKKFFISVGGKF